MDFQQIKGKQKISWETGNYGMIGTMLQMVSEELCEQMDIRAGSNVLDLCTGSGNAAISAARRWCKVTGIDYAPTLLEHARERAKAEQLPIEFIEADAENLPFEDQSFEVILSTFGIAFAPNQEKAASEMTRVCKVGGRIALANWVPDDFIAEIFKAVAKYIPPAKGLNSPLRWGDPAALNVLIGENCKVVSSEIKAINYRYESARHFVEHHRRYYGPIMRAFESLNDDQRELFDQDLIEACHKFNQSTNQDIVIPARYLASVFEK